MKSHLEENKIAVEAKLSSLAAETDVRRNLLRKAILQKSAHLMGRLARLT